MTTVAVILVAELPSDAGTPSSVPDSDPGPDFLPSSSCPKKPVMVRLIIIGHVNSY